MGQLPRVELSHLGIWVTDLAMMESFYTRLYGFHVSDRGTVKETNYVFLTLDSSVHHQIVLASGRPASVSFNVLNQVSFKVGSLADLRVFHDALVKEDRVSNIRPMTHGNAWSVYFADPEGNRSEIFTDTPWHVAQPFGVPIDLTRPEDEIVRETEAMVRANDSTRPFADWRQETEATLTENARPSNS
jgi:catechol-2,3-dioxygenase